MSSDQKQEKRFKKKDDEIEEQKNKGHRGLNKKLKKRRKHEKEVKKDKKQKKKDYADKRDKYREQYFAQAKKGSKSKNEKDSKGVKIHKLQKTVHKFLKIYEDDIEDVKGIFSSLDDGEEIEIQDIENPKIRKYLAKIFKYLKIKQKTGKIGYRKSIKTEFSLANYMKTIISDGLLAISSKQSDSEEEDNERDHKNKQSGSDSDSSDSDDDENDHKKGKEPSKKLKKNSDSDNDDDDDDDDDDISDEDSQSDDEDDKKTQTKGKQQQEEVKKLGPQLPKSVIGPSIPNTIGPIIPSSSVGPSLISQEEKQKFLQNSLSSSSTEQTSQNNNWMIAGDLDSFLNDSFKEVESSNVKKFLQNKKGAEVKRVSGPTLPNSRLAEGSAPIDLENIQIDDSEKKGRDAEEYEQKYRSKSLMEIHQENLQKKKLEQGKDHFRKPFDRNEDLVIKKDSKKLFAALKESFQHGPKFQPASQN